MMSDSFETAHGDPHKNSTRDAVLIPVKAFDAAKERLAPVLDRDERIKLAHLLAKGVLEAASPLPVAVVCDDADVAQWATDNNAIVVWAPGRGLNVAVESGVAHLEALGFEQITVCHADLPYPKGLTSLPRLQGVTLVPDRHGDGTNIIVLPREAGFRFSYGKGSFDRHIEEVKRLGFELHIIQEDDLGLDIDIPEDFALLDAQTRQWGPEGPH